MSRLVSGLLVELEFNNRACNFSNILTIHFMVQHLRVLMNKTHGRNDLCQISPISYKLIPTVPIHWIKQIQKSKKLTQVTIISIQTFVLLRPIWKIQIWQISSFVLKPSLLIFCLIKIYFKISVLLTYFVDLLHFENYYKR